MKEMNNIPVVIGITGHRDLSQIDINKFKTIIKEQMNSVILKCPNSKVKLLTSLAEGADQLCAEVALDLNIGIVVALPMEVEDYRNDFEEEALNKFNSLLFKAERVFVVPDIEEKEFSSKRDYCYRQASIYVSEHCHLLLALWDNSIPSLDGCGTAEAVEFALNHSYIHKDRCIKKDDGYVVQIYTPRNKDTSEAGKITYLGNKDAFEETITKIDQVNKEGANPDQLSILNGDKYHRMLKLLAILGVIVAMSFLLYDEAMLLGMLMVLGASIVFMFISYRIADKSDYHNKYIDYRMLAECIRMQEHLDNIGSKLEVADYMNWSKRFDTPWIYKTMKVLAVFKKEGIKEDIKENWLLEQYNYHKNSISKTKELINRNNKIVNISLVVSIVMYIFTLVFEYYLAYKVTWNIEVTRAIIKTIVGGFSTASIFAANYYGKLSLQRIYEDHIRMTAFFEKAIEYVDKNGSNDYLIKEIIKEEISENTNWCSYEKDNEVNLTI